MFAVDDRRDPEHSARLYQWGSKEFEQSLPTIRQSQRGKRSKRLLRVTVGSSRARDSGDRAGDPRIRLSENGRRRLIAAIGVDCKEIRTLEREIAQQFSEKLKQQRTKAASEKEFRRHCRYRQTAAEEIELEQSPVPLGSSDRIRLIPAGEAQTAAGETRVDRS